MQILIEVTAAVIHKDEKLLVCQRPEGKRCELLWEFPGGKIEAGETPEECLMRECREELGVTIEIEQLLRKVEYAYPEITVNIRFYFCKLIVGEPTCIEHNDIRWRTLDKILKLPLCPADKKMMELAAEDIRRIMQFNIAKQNYDETVDYNICNFREKAYDKYHDPDDSSLYECVVDGLTITLAQDGLCSINRIKDHSINIVSDYKLIRKNMFDCLVWPAYAMSINQMRSAKYDDRLDLLLLDIEKFYGIVNSKTELTSLITAEIFKNCELGRAYLFPNTFYWLRSFCNFDGFIKSRKLQEFVEKQGSHFHAKKWTNSIIFDDCYYKVLLDKVTVYKNLCK